MVLYLGNAANVQHFTGLHKREERHIYVALLAQLLIGNNTSWGWGGIHHLNLLGPLEEFDWCMGRGD